MPSQHIRNVKDLSPRERRDLEQQAGVSLNDNQQVIYIITEQTVPFAPAKETASNTDSDASVPGWGLFRDQAEDIAAEMKETYALRSRPSRASDD